MEGIGESLYHECKQFGVDTCIVEPGYFRTSFLSGFSMVPTSFPDAYKKVVDEAEAGLQAYNGNQPGDPVKAVARILDIVKQEGVAKGKGIPQHVLLGSDAIHLVSTKLKATLESIEEWKDISLSTDLPKGN